LIFLNLWPSGIWASGRDREGERIRKGVGRAYFEGAIPAFAWCDWGKLCHLQLPLTGKLQKMYFLMLVTLETY